MKRQKILYIILILVVTGLVIVIFFPFGESSEKPRTRAEQPPLKIEGKIHFLDGQKGDTVTFIRAAVADNFPERNRGLMYRYSMPEDVGMIFIFERKDYLSFWMKNTHISLDIIYVDENMLIVDIHEHTIPYSEEMIPSKIKALYAVEVNAGFCERHGIEPGDRITFRRIPAK